MISVRWLAIAVFLFSSTLNYLDRQVLAATAPSLLAEFHLTKQDYGVLLQAFSIAYALSAPFAGLLIDRAGLNRGFVAAVGVWSLAGLATGWVNSFGALLAARSVLGAAEAAGVPGTGKANATYLEPQELAFGTAMSQIGLSLGGILAPLLAGFLGARYGWRSVFVLCGILGFVWIPIWLWTASRVPKRSQTGPAAKGRTSDLFTDRRFWALVAANMIYMTIYTLWTNWTTLYLVHARGLSEVEANRYFSWIPPVFATLGGFAGGSMAYRWIVGGVPVFRARMRVCWISSALVLATAAVPSMPTAFLAAAIISFSYFWITAMSTNVYVMPIDFFGAERAAFGVSALVFAYGLMQALVSPLIGRLVDHPQIGFSGVFLMAAPLPLVAALVLQLFCHDHPARHRS